MLLLELLLLLEANRLVMIQLLAMMVIVVVACLVVVVGLMAVVLLQAQVNRIIVMIRWEAESLCLLQALQLDQEEQVVQCRRIDDVHVHIHLSCHKLMY